MVRLPVALRITRQCKTMSSPGCDRDALYLMLVRRSDRLGRVQLNACHLAGELGVSHQTVSGMVAILVAEGHLRRLRHRGPKESSSKSRRGSSAPVIPDRSTGTHRLFG
jgi:hypothetical protein